MPQNGKTYEASPGVKAACDALRDDAKKWQTAGEAVSKATTRANELTLGSGQVANSSETAKFLKAYSDFQHRLAGLLGQGTSIVGNVAALLTSAADTYQEEDAIGAHRMKKEEQPDG